jgi:hypothetical protein
MMNPLRSAIGASFATSGGGPSWGGGTPTDGTTMLVAARLGGIDATIAARRAAAARVPWLHHPFARGRSSVTRFRR